MLRWRHTRRTRHEDGGCHIAWSQQCVDQKSSRSRSPLCVKLPRHGSAIILNDFYATGTAFHKANGAITKLSLVQNTIGDKGAIALADALKATFAMCFFLRYYKHVLLAIVDAVSR